MAAVLTLYEQIVEYYLNKIRSGELKPGSYIHTEEECARLFDISRGTVRKAYAHMFELGYITRTRGKGTRIAEDIFERISKFKLGVREDVRKIGVVILDSDEFLFTIIRTLEEGIAERGWKMELMFNDNMEKEKYCIESLISMCVDGIVIIPFRASDNSFSFSNFYRLIDSGIPFVMIGKPPMGIVCDSVYAEDYMGSMDIVAELYQRGCRTTAHVTDSHADNMVYHDRIKGYELGINKYRQKKAFIFDVRDCDFDEKFSQFLRAHREKLGINLYSDKLLGHVYELLLRENRKFGADVFTIGFNENAHLKNFGLKRLCMEIPKVEIARAALKIIEERLAGAGGNSFTHTIFSTELRVDQNE